MSRARPRSTTDRTRGRLADVTDDDRRTDLIVRTLDDAFSDLMRADPLALRLKFREMAADPHVFHREDPLRLRRPRP